MKYPFVYIASLPRMGSTLISEALTELPFAFIFFREPHIAKNTFRPKQTDVERFKSYGFDISTFLKYRLIFAFFLRRLRFLGFPQDYMVREFKYKLMPQMAGFMMQVGVKEIDNRGWRNYYAHFPEMKVVLTGRDPRDIYLSLFHKWKAGKFSQYDLNTPESFIKRLNEQFQLQRAIEIAADCIRVRYEDLCTNPSIMEQIKSFVFSPLQNPGLVGQFNAREAHREDEAAFHGGRNTDKHVARWKHETDPCLREEADHVFELMKGYTEFWGYQ